jgi:Protein of unknown function (DUF2934)
MDNKNHGPTHEEIERRAYQIYLEHGFQPGNELADWLAAERELSETPEKPEIAPTTRKHALLRSA